MKSDWDVVGWVQQNVPRYWSAAVQAAEAKPEAASWFVRTEPGDIVIPNTRKAPLGTLYNIVIAPTRLVGGPTPLSLGLLGAIYGGLLGRGLGKLLIVAGLLDNTTWNILRAATIAGAAAGAAPGMLTGAHRMLRAPDMSSLLSGWTAPWPKKAYVAEPPWRAMRQPLYEPQWRDMVLEDAFLTDEEKALAAGPPYAAALATRSSIVTPMDVAAVASNTVLGATYGNVLGMLAGKVLSASPEVRQMLKQTGMFAGMLKGLVGRVL